MGIPYSGEGAQCRVACAVLWRRASTCHTSDDRMHLNRKEPCEVRFIDVQHCASTIAISSEFLPSAHQAREAFFLHVGSRARRFQPTPFSFHLARWKLHRASLALSRASQARLASSSRWLSVVSLQCPSTTPLLRGGKSTGGHRINSLRPHRPVPKTSLNRRQVPPGGCHAAIAPPPHPCATCMTRSHGDHAFHRPRRGGLGRHIRRCIAWKPVRPADATLATAGLDSKLASGKKARPVEEGNPTVTHCHRCCMSLDMRNPERFEDTTRVAMHTRICPLAAPRKPIPFRGDTAPCRPLLGRVANPTDWPWHMHHAV